MLTIQEVQSECDTILIILVLFEASMALVIDQMLTDLANAATQSYSYGEAIGASLAEGLWSQYEAVLAAGIALVRAARGIPSNRGGGYSGGGSDPYGGAVAVHGSSNGSVYAASVGESEGKAFGDGFAKGVSSSLQVHSPSRVMEKIGKYASLGFANGIAEGGPDITTGFTNIMNPLYAALSDIMSEDFDVSPTITPVVDMSNVSDLFGMMSNYDASYAATAARRVSSSQQSQYDTNNGNGMTGSQQDSTLAGIVVNVYPSAGMDEKALADKVITRINEAEYRRSVAKG